jgi:hypothetical protein
LVGYLLLLQEFLRLFYLLCQARDKFTVENMCTYVIFAKFRREMRGRRNIVFVDEMGAKILPSCSGRTPGARTRRRQRAAARRGAYNMWWQCCACGAGRQQKAAQFLLSVGRHSSTTDNGAAAEAAAARGSRRRFRSRIAAIRLR